MKERILNQIYGTPLTYPYFDEETLRAIEPMDIRFRVSTLEVTEKIAEDYGFSLDRVPEMILAQFQAGRHVADKLESTGMSKIAACELSGMDKTMLTKYTQGKRPFSPSATVIPPFAFNVMNESCHKLMFGTEGKVMLPSIYAEMARAMAAIPVEEREALLRKASIQWAIYEKQNPREVENAPHREVSKMIGERIFELSYDKGTQFYQVLGQDTPYYVRFYLSQFTIEDYKHESPRLSLLMYLSFETGLALDYFIAENFTKKVPCFYQAGDETIELKDQTALNVIGICAALPVETRSKLIGEVIGAGLSKEFQS